MTADRRRAILVSIMLIMLAVTAAWSVGAMRDDRSVARGAADDLAACESLVRDIKQLRAQPTVASSDAMDIQELGAHIESATARAGIQAAALESVLPQSERRFGNSPYVHKPTVLTLRRVRLAQLMAFLHHLSDDTGLTVRDFRLRMPVGDDAAERWDAEATLTYLIYAPPTPSRDRE